MQLTHNHTQPDALNAESFQPATAEPSTYVVCVNDMQAHNGHTPHTHAYTHAHQYTLTSKPLHTIANRQATTPGDTLWPNRTRSPNVTKTVPKFLTTVIVGTDRCLSLGEWVSGQWVPHSAVHLTQWVCESERAVSNCEWVHKSRYLRISSTDEHKDEEKIDWQPLLNCGGFQTGKTYEFEPSEKKEKEESEAVLKMGETNTQAVKQCWMSEGEREREKAGERDRWIWGLDEKG